MAVVNLHETYSKKIDEAFTRNSVVKGRLNPENEFTGARSVRVSAVNTVPLNDYDRAASANRYGEPTEVGDTLQELTMSQDKSFSAVIDKGNTKDQAINKAGKFMNIQTNEMVIPEYDKYCLGRLANLAGNIVGNAAAIDAENVVARVAAARKAFLDAKVPLADRTWYVTSALFNALLECKHFVQLEKLGVAALSENHIGNLFKSPVIEVPEDYLPAGVNFILVHKRAACAPEKIWDNKLHTDPPGISGNLIEGRFYYDCFVYGKKANGVYADVTTGNGVTVLAAPTVAAATGAITVASGATAWYTTDGSDPRYSITAKAGATTGATKGMVVKAYQVKEGSFASPVTTVTVTG
jgi:hypothetical protein